MRPGCIAQCDMKMLLQLLRGRGNHCYLVNLNNGVSELKSIGLDCSAGNTINGLALSPLEFQ